MKFVISLTVIVLIFSIVYFFLQKSKKLKKRALTISIVLVVALLILLADAMIQSSIAPDTQCITTHSTTSTPSAALKTAMDYFNQGNYDYDTGACAKAIADYTKSIKLDSKYPQAYNNRAYTYMRLQDYQDALPDLEKAISLNSNYIQALMNRGDIYNFYLIDRKSAIADYEKVISLGATQGTSVCGHLFMAIHKGWNLGTFLSVPTLLFSYCK